MLVRARTVVRTGWDVGGRKATPRSCSTLQLKRRRGDDCGVARTLTWLCDVNRRLGLSREGIQQGKEAVEIYERLCDTIGQANCWNHLALALHNDNQLDAASRAINLVLEKGQDSLVCESHPALGAVYQYKGETEKAIHHLQTGLEIASALGRHDLIFDIHETLAWVLLNQDKLSEANAHVKQLKLRAADNLHRLGRAT